jgi:ligand-binding sensor domain-containing protein
MITKILAMALVLLIADLSCGSLARAQDKDTVKQVPVARVLTKKEMKRASKFRKVVKELGVGPNARTEIRYAGGTHLKGYVSESAEDYFVMTDETTNVSTRVEYAQVEKALIWPSAKTLIKRDVNSPSGFFKKLAIGAGIGFAVLLTVCGISKQCQE